MTHSTDTGAVTRNTKLRVSVASLAAAQPSILYLRDGDVVLYRRSRSLLYQCRYRLADGTWQRVSTRKASIEHAVAVFRRLMRESGLALTADGQNRTLYSLRHIYATLELLRNSTDIHTLSKQMGNSAAMIERHYS